MTKNCNSKPKTYGAFQETSSRGSKLVTKYFLNKPKNLKLVYEYTVTPWIKSCNLHIHAGCMTSLESAFLNKSQIVFMPNIDETFKKLQISNHMFDDLEKCITFLDRNFIKPSFKKKILYNSLLNYKSGSHSCEEIASFLNSKFGSMKNSRIYSKFESDEIFF